MAIFFTARWSVNRADAAECSEALKAITEHIKNEHPAIKSVRTWTEWVGPGPRNAYLWMEEYESLTAMDQEEGTPECVTVWEPVYRLAQPGSFNVALTMDALKDEVWFTR